MFRFVYYLVLFDVLASCLGLAVKVSVNRLFINTLASNDEETRFNARGEYLYRDGELAMITCHTEKEFLNMRFKFGDDDWPEVFTQYTDTPEQAIYLKLNEHHDGYFLDCMASLQVRSLTYSVRLYFKRGQHLHQNKPEFYVNRLGLTPIKTSAGVLKYTYEYYGGEQLTIEGKLATENSRWYCNTSAVQDLNQAVNQTKGINMTVTLPQKDNMPLKASLNCIAGNTDVHLSLEPIPILFYPALSGLSSAKTIHRYNESRKSHVIKYIHNPNENLRLTCLTNIPRCEWHYDKNLFSIGSSFNEHVRSFNKSQLFIPIKNNRQTTIQCSCRQKIRKEKQVFRSIANIYIEAQKTTTAAPTATTKAPTTISITVSSTASTTKAPTTTPTTTAPTASTTALTTTASMMAPTTASMMASTTASTTTSTTASTMTSTTASLTNSTIALTTASTASSTQSAEEFCFYKLDVGPCTEFRASWGYDYKSGHCTIFQYGGCGGNRNNFPEERICQHFCRASQDLFIFSPALMIAGSAVGVTAVAAIIVLIGYRNSRARKHQGCDTDANAHLYEVVDYSKCRKPVQRNPEYPNNAEDALYETADDSASVPGLASEPDIASRLPHPLPPDVEEENKKYRHYDVVYEERINRIFLRNAGHVRKVFGAQHNKSRRSWLITRP